MGRDVPAIASETKSFGPEDVAAATSYQQEKQAALDVELAGIEKELNRGKDELLAAKRDAEAMLDSEKDKKKLLQEDIDKLQGQIDELKSKLEMVNDPAMMQSK